MARFVAKLEFLAGASLLLVIVALVFAAAVMRFFGHPLIWSVDMAQLLFIWLCFVGATRAMRQRGHIGVDLLVRLMGHRYRLWLETAQAVVFLGFMGVLMVEGYKLTLMNKERLFGDSGISYAFVTIAVPAGCIMLSLAIMANAVDAWRNRADEKDLIFTKAEEPPAPVVEQL